MKLLLANSTPMIDMDPRSLCFGFDSRYNDAACSGQLAWLRLSQLQLQWASEEDATAVTATTTAVQKRKQVQMLQYRASVL